MSDTFLSATIISRVTEAVRSACEEFALGEPSIFIIFSREDGQAEIAISWTRTTYEQHVGGAIPGSGNTESGA